MSTVPAKPHHHPPEAVDHLASAAGLRAVAVFEASKGVLVVALAIVLIAVRGQIEDYAEDFLYALHLDPDRRFSRMVLQAASKLSDARTWTLALAAATYSTVRFVEAWGLWHLRVWAEWFALLSGALYLPWEIMKVAERATWERIGVLAINVAIVLYMLVIRVRDARSRG
jgi:uncharacterized membrane protein (DUF2068 family)